MNIPNLISFMVYAIPLALVWLAGGLYALIQWRRHPGVSLLAFLACVLLLCNALLGQFAQFWLIEQRMAQGWSTAQISVWFGVLGAIRTAVSVAGYVLLLVAVFGWRYAPLHRPAPVEPRSSASRAGIDPEGIRKPGRAE